MYKCAICGEPFESEDPLTFQRYHTYDCGSQYDGVDLEFTLCPNCYDYILSKIILNLTSVTECVDSLHGDEFELDQLKIKAKRVADNVGCPFDDNPVESRMFAREDRLFNLFIELLKHKKINLDDPILTEQDKKDIEDELDLQYMVDDVDWVRHGSRPEDLPDWER